MTSPSLDALLAAVSAGDLREAAACFAAEGRYQEAAHAPIVGRDAIAAHFARFAAQGRRWRFIVDEVFGEANRACVVYRYAEGEGAGGRERAGVAIIRLAADGSIAEWREYADG